jgi:hypothetical protein
MAVTLYLARHFHGKNLLDDAWIFKQEASGKHGDLAEWESIICGEALGD